jgi:hypothetical protein
MVLRAERQVVDAANAEGARSSAFLHRTEERTAAFSPQAMLKGAQELLMQVLAILNDPSWERYSGTEWSFKLARAHALTLLDHLARMAEPQKSSPPTK